MLNPLKFCGIRSPYCGSGYDPRETQPSLWNDTCMDALLAMLHGVNAVPIPLPRLNLSFRSARNKFHRIVSTAKQSLWSFWSRDPQALAARCPCGASLDVERAC